MKKLVSILLALVMVLSMGAVAFAEEPVAGDETPVAGENADAPADDAADAPADDAADAPADDEADAPADDEADAPADDEADAPAVSVGEIVDLFKQIFSMVDLETIKGVASETIATIEGLGGIIAPLFGSENGTPSFSLAEVPAMLMNAFIDGIAGLFGTDRESIIDKLLEIPFVKEIMGWYGYKPAETTVPATEAPTEAPVETEVPNTGATAGIAAFAALSVAAAAAFVSKKKEA